MKKLLLGTLLFGSMFQTNAQDFNQWSIDVGVGVHTPVFPLASGYNPEIKQPDFWQTNLGVRYMFNEKFGLRLDLGYNKFTEGKNSKPFESNYYRASLEGVVNAGNILNFKSWTNRFNLLLHGGAGFSRLYPKSPVDASRDQVINVMAGITPQVKLTDRVSLFFDVSAIGHFYQQRTFDGTATIKRRGLTGGIFNYSAGLNIALGNHEKHADWYYEDVMEANELEEIQNRLQQAEDKIAELKKKNTDFDKNKLMSELDRRYNKANTNNNATNTVANKDFVKELFNNGYVNVYFDVNKTTIQKGSHNAINYLKLYMKQNSSVNAELIGYADETGLDGYNTALSAKRAKKVYDILVAAGIDASRLSYKGNGEDTSVSKDARQLARRVTFFIK
ncbi:OmpA family protein [Polaribacter cellanae]|uniref:OmpA family protein n=1 Tax=Polaribacter cellanae TaxID=2818493 RepID=A0A975H6M2_9FLAO|nr:OmpA family protein [Polaribacter cellanae]QTE22064.1 OmpA family protein [Polaribacter cellanae]